jgi:hypothetical protein
MAEEEKKEDTNDNFFGRFNNKFTRGGAAALIAAYAAKKDPYLLEGFAEGLKEKDQADREARNALIKASTETHLRLQAENRKRRLQARELGINPYVAGKAYKAGTLDTLINLKMENPSYDVNSVYKISEQYKDKISGLTHSQIIESLVGPTQKLDEMFSNIKAPKRTNFLRNWIEGTDEDTSIVSDVKRIVSAQDMSKDDSGYVDVDYSGITPTEKGQQTIAAFLRKDPTTKVQLTQAVKNFTSNFMNVGLRYDSKMGDYVFDSDNIENVKYANLISKHFVDEAEQLIRDPNSVAFNNRETALSIIENKYLIPTEEGPRKLNFAKINEQYENPIIPEGWTPPTPTKTEIKKAEEKQKEENETKEEDENLTPIEKHVKRWEEQKQKIKDKYKGMPKLIALEIKKQKKPFEKQMNDLKGNINLLTND